MEVKRLGVVGGGLMGSGIVQVAAQAGLDVIFSEVSQAAIEKTVQRIDDFLSQGVRRGKVKEEEKSKALAHINGTVGLDGLAICDFVIEAIFENMQAKKGVFAALDKVVTPETILATNTSCLSVTEIAAAVRRPERVAGMHFFNPVPLMKLVEVIRAEQTSEDTINQARELARFLGKEPILAKDSPGFVANFFGVPYLNQAIQALDDGLASKEDIDKAVELGMGYPMGPFRLLDLVGIDTALDVTRAMYEETSDPRFAPPPLLKRMVRAGYFGIKSGKGFYEYKK